MCQKTKVFVLDKFLWVKNIFRYQDPGTARHGNIWHGTDHKGTARKYMARHGSTRSGHGTGRPCVKGIEGTIIKEDLIEIPEPMPTKLPIQTAKAMIFSVSAS